MPELNPLAGFSPICWVVFAQIEHCATAVLMVRTEVVKERNNMNRPFFISAAKVLFLWGKND